MFKDILLAYRLNFRAMRPKARIRAMVRLGSGFLPGGFSAPISLMVAITGACQCKCAHCGVADNLSEHELSVDEINRIVREYRDAGGVRVVFTGGEPLLHPGLTRVIEYASSLSVASHVDTNGLALTEELACNLQRAGLCSIEFSIDFLDEAKMERNRGVPNILPKVKHAIELARIAGLTVTINTVAFKESLGRGLTEIVEYGRRAGVDAVRINSPEAAGRWRESRDVLLTPSELAQFEKHNVPGFVISSVCGQIGGFAQNCSGLNGRLLNVRPDGAVTPCPYMLVPIGDVRSESLREILARLRKFCERSEFSSVRCPSDDPEFMRYHGGWPDERSL